MTAFVITGYVPLTMWRHCVGRSVKAFESNGALLFHRQVTPLDIIVSRCILEILGSIIAGLVVACLAMLTGFMEPPEDFGLLYLGLFFISWFCTACAMIMAPLSEMGDILDKMVNAIMYLSIPFSGAFAMVEWVPQAFQGVLLWSPSVHALEMIRSGQFGPTLHVHYDPVFLVSSCAIMTLVGLSLSLRSRKYIRVQ